MSSLYSTLQADHVKQSKEKYLKVLLIIVILAFDCATEVTQTNPVSSTFGVLHTNSRQGKAQILKGPEALFTASTGEKRKIYCLFSSKGSLVPPTKSKQTHSTPK